MRIALASRCVQNEGESTGSFLYFIVLFMKGIVMKKLVKEYLLCTIGVVMFVCGINIVISPLGLYNGGFVGIGQLVRYVLEHFAGITLGSVDLAGIVYFLLNVPLFVLAYRSMSKNFLYKTVYTVVLQTFLLSLVPIAKESFTDDILTACIVGGIIAGFGAGIILRAGSSGGGQDILGVYFAKKLPGFSVGKITLLVNGFVYVCCALLFDMKIVVYSLIYTCVMSTIIDRVHSQNINNTVLILTKKKGLEEFVIRELNRGITVWEGHGGYTNEPITIGMVSLSKYELPVLKRKIQDFDKGAFMVVSRNNSIYGNFEKRMEA